VTKDLDEFDEKARKFIETGNKERIADILKEFAMVVSYDEGKELKNPTQFMKKTGLKNAEIDDFTEYQVAKSFIKDHIKNGGDVA
jgi:hypothetical protein